MVSWASNRLDVFGLGTNNKLFHKWWDGSKWGPSPTDREGLGGILTSPPVAVSWDSNRLDIFGIGTDNQMYHQWWDGSKWGGWEGLGGVFNSHRQPSLGPRAGLTSLGLGPTTRCSTNGGTTLGAHLKLPGRRWVGPSTQASDLHLPNTSETIPYPLAVFNGRIESTMQRPSHLSISYVFLYVLIHSCLNGRCTVAY